MRTFGFDGRAEEKGTLPAPARTVRSASRAWSPGEPRASADSASWKLASRAPASSMVHIIVSLRQRNIDRLPSIALEVFAI